MGIENKFMRFDFKYWSEVSIMTFKNRLVVVDVNGYVVLSRPGFLGHIHDNTCYRYLWQ